MDDKATNTSASEAFSAVRVLRYAHDGGFSPGEWRTALSRTAFGFPIIDGHVERIGVQITKTRTIDVVVRIELCSGIVSMLLAGLGRTRSDTLFKNPRACRSRVKNAGRPLALLAGKFGARSARVLVCEARD